MRDRLSWYMVFLILPTILLARSLDKDRRVPYNIPSDWKALWFSNLDELQRVNEANDNNTVSNVTVQLGGTAFLHCKVRNLAERTVSDAEISWIRRRDFHVLTSSMFTYTNDERFQVLHPEGSDDWTLQIKYVQERDNGTYECQVSRSAGILSHFVNLNIVIPEAFILGSDEHHVDVGSIINLVCIIEKSPTPPQYVFWYHNNRMINYDTTRGSVTVQTDPGPTQSRLTIRQAVETDTGNYTCSASNTKPASIFVFVTEGKYKQRTVSYKANFLNQYNAVVPRQSPLTTFLSKRIPTRNDPRTNEIEKLASIRTTRTNGSRCRQDSDDDDDDDDDGSTTVVQ
ncbi:Leucine-rich repeats and immunoglobulin-like domains protein 1 [Temnothorax longispinosus]|uniref:Leucine-rich repeats and immunoglobulin-like domains protein 1 n=1 Tax=Temnothorax longispinosus TaxID=300112 RepID=A0A4S2L6K3_9HYME|nr:Leucine-rich repeats and immunoglobulin-like domains protein 1 [Temnothorax longispinosus]